MSETLGVCALVLSAEVCDWFPVSFCEGALRVFRLPRPGAAFRPGHLFPEGECEHARPQYFADQPRVTGNVDPRALALTTMPEQHSDYGILTFWIFPHSRAA